MLNGWFSSRRDFSSSHGSGFGRAGAFIQGLSVQQSIALIAGLVLAVSDTEASAGLRDRFARERQIGNLLEGEFLVGFQIAGIDVVLVCPLGAFAHETFVE